MHVTGSKYHALATSPLTRDPHVFPYHLCVLGFSMNKDFLFEQTLDFGTFNGKNNANVCFFVGEYSRAIQSGG